MRNGGPEIANRKSQIANPKLLSEMKEGQHARIVRVGGEGPLRRRMLEMGFLKGTEVYVEKYAPLKDPVELIVKGYHVSLRVEEAARVVVDQVNPKTECL